MTEDVYDTSSEERRGRLLARAAAAASPRTLGWMPLEELEDKGIVVPATERGCVGSRDCPCARKGTWRYLVYCDRVVTDKHGNPQIR